MTAKRKNNKQSSTKQHTGNSKPETGNKHQTPALSKAEGSNFKLQTSNKNQQTETPKPKNKYVSYIIIASIVLLTFIIFSQCINHEFLNWDDDQLVYESPYVKAVADIGISGAAHKFGIDFFQNNPVTIISHAITYKIWGLNPKPYHLLNLLLHVFNTLLVFFLVRFITKRSEAAIIATLLFALHPLRVESVAWVTERKDVLYTFFYLGSLLSYIYYVIRQKKKWFIISLILFPFALLSKFAAVTLPFALILADYYFKRGFTKKVILEKIPFFILVAICGITQFSSSEAADAVQNITTKFSLTDRIFFANYSLLFYILKFFAPFNLSALYPYPAKVTGSLPSSYYMSPVFVILIFALAVWLIYKSKNLRNDLVFGILFFLVNIFLVLHFVPFGGNIIVADRYAYMAHIGICFIFGQWFCLIKDNKTRYAKQLKLPFVFGISVFVIIITVATWNRVNIFKDSYTLFTDVIEKEPMASVAYSNRGLAKEKKKDMQGALQDYNKAIEIVPDYLEAHINRGNVRKTLGDNKGALEDFEKAVSINPKFPIAYNNRGIAKSNLNDLQGAMDDYAKAISLNPEYADPYHNRGLIKSKNLQKYEDALTDYNKALSLKPNYKEAYNNRGVTKFEMKDYAGCISDINKVIELEPSDAMAYLIRGHAKYYLKQTADACLDWQKSLQLGNTNAEELLKQYCKN
ncbi:MAG: tetratricopeptide repeat protein [Bacteroidia bacterium]|nr:tetratricopeptide repeat protein [Bacteroidia bacterium]